MTMLHFPLFLKKGFYFSDLLTHEQQCIRGVHKTSAVPHDNRRSHTKGQFGPLDRLQLHPLLLRKLTVIHVSTGQWFQKCACLVKSVSVLGYLYSQLLLLLLIESLKISLALIFNITLEGFFNQFSLRPTRYVTDDSFS